MTKYTRKTIAWAESFNTCWRCGERRHWEWGLEIHHFVRGSYRQKNNLATTAMLCFHCHRFREHGNDALGLMGMLRLKKLHDPAHYDLAEVNRVRGRAPDAITEEEVDKAA